MVNPSERAGALPSSEPDPSPAISADINRTTVRDKMEVTGVATDTATDTATDADIGEPDEEDIGETTTLAPSLATGGLVNQIMGAGTSRSMIKPTGWMTDLSIRTAGWDTNQRADSETPSPGGHTNQTPRGTADSETPSPGGHTNRTSQFESPSPGGFSATAAITGILHAATILNDTQETAATSANRLAHISDHINEATGDEITTQAINEPTGRAIGDGSGDVTNEAPDAETTSGDVNMDHRGAICGTLGRTIDESITDVSNEATNGDVGMEVSVANNGTTDAPTRASVSNGTSMDISAVSNEPTTVANMTTSEKTTDAAMDEIIAAAIKRNIATAITRAAEVEIACAAINDIIAAANKTRVNETTVNETVGNEGASAATSEASDDILSNAGVEAYLPAHAVLPDFSIHRAPATKHADLSKPSIATLPYYLQAAIFEAAANIPRIFFMEIEPTGEIGFYVSEDGLSSACLLSREMLLTHRRLYMCGKKLHWINPELDIFYLYNYDHGTPMHQRLSWEALLLGDVFEWFIVQNVAVDLEFLKRYETLREQIDRDGPEPRTMMDHDLRKQMFRPSEYEVPIFRLWDHFHSLRSIHVFVPSGPSGRRQLTPLESTPETLLLTNLPPFHEIYSHGGYNEIWGFTKYKIKKVCTRIDLRKYGGAVRPNDRFEIDLFGHLTSLRIGDNDDEGDEDDVDDEDKQDEESHEGGEDDGIYEDEGEDKENEGNEDISAPQAAETPLTAQELRAQGAPVVQ